MTGFPLFMRMVTLFLLHDMDLAREHFMVLELSNIAVPYY